MVLIHPDVATREPGTYVAVTTDLTPHSSDADFDMTRGVYIGAAGNLEVVMADGTSATFLNLAAGAILPIKITGTRAAGTTTTNIIRLY